MHDRRWIITAAHCFTGKPEFKITKGNAKSLTAKNYEEINKQLEKIRVVVGDYYQDEAGYKTVDKLS